MTGQTGTSNFNARADAAAGVLLDDLRKKGRNVESRKVQVGPDGQPAKPLPPEGSYMRLEIERQRAEAETAQQQQLAQQQREVPQQQQPPAEDSSHQPAPTGTATAEVEDGLSENARRRFAQVSHRLREAERERDQEREERHREMEELRALKAQVEAMRNEREQLMTQNLDALDPIDRAAVLSDARIKELLREQEQRIKAEFRPQIEGLRERSIESDMLLLSQRYPAFDVDIHGPLIEQFRKKNPNCTVEQAFRAIAEPDEITPRSLRAHVPPVVEPGSGPNAARAVPVQERDPEDAMREDSRKAAELMRSSDPKDHREGMRLYERNIAQRYARRLGT